MVLPFTDKDDRDLDDNNYDGNTEEEEEKDEWYHADEDEGNILISLL